MTDHKEIVTADDIPDRVSISRESPFFHPQFAKIGVKLNGEERPNDTYEFCVSKGWVKKILYKSGTKKPILERGKSRTLLIRGEVTTFIKPTKGTAK